MKIGAPWLLNPVLAGLTLVLVCPLARKLSSAPSAPGWAMLLTVASPAFVANAISYYSMEAHLFCTLLYSWLLLTPSWKRAFLAGLVGSVALVLHNPFPHLLVGIPWIVWLAANRDRRRYLVALFAGYLPISIVCGPGWLYFLSNVVDKPHVASTAAAAGKQSFLAWLGSVLANNLSVPDLIILRYRLVGIAKLFIWAVPALPMLALLGYRQAGKGNALARLLGWGALATLAFYLVIPWDQGHGWGYRYFHAAFGALPLLAVALLDEPRTRTQFVRLAGALAFSSLVVLSPLALVHIHSFVHECKLAVPDPPPDTLRLVFVRPERAYYGQDMVRNHPFLDTPTWVLLGKGDEDEKALVRKRFPNAVQVGSTRVGTVWDVPLEGQTR